MELPGHEPGQPAYALRFLPGDRRRGEDGLAGAAPQRQPQETLSPGTLDDRGLARQPRLAGELFRPQLAVPHGVSCSLDEKGALPFTHAPEVEAHAEGLLEQQVGAVQEVCQDAIRGDEGR